MSARAAGFTLLELLLAVTLTAVVMAAAAGTVNLFSAADRAATHGYGLDVEVQRALRLLEEDVQRAVAITTGVRSLRCERPDGKVVSWVRPTGDEELHRVVGDDAPAADTLASNLLASMQPLEFDGRGRLRDASYRDSAVLQGAHAFVLTMVTSPRNGAVIGVQVSITTAAGDRRTRRSITACSLRLVEANCKPPAP